jgi:hypothetical protein
MALVRTFLNAFKKGQDDAAAKNRADALEHARSDGLLGPTTESAAADLTPPPLRPPSVGRSTDIGTPERQDRPSDPP